MHYFLLLCALLLPGCDKKPTNHAAIKPSPLVVIKIPAAMEHTQEKAEPAPEGKHTQNTHAHGAAKLQIIAEGNLLSVDMSMPSSDAVGFEHAASNATEKAQLTATLNTLQAPDYLFELSPAAGCTLKQGSVATALLNPQPAPAEHADFDAHYEWECTNAARIKNISIKLFTYFKSLEKITADYIVDTKQGGIELRRNGQTQINFD